MRWKLPAKQASVRQHNSRRDKIVLIIVVEALSYLP